MYKKIVLLVLAIAAVLMSACNKVSVKVVLPTNGCDNIACITTDNQSDGAIIVNGKDITH